MLSQKKLKLGELMIDGVSEQISGKRRQLTVKSGKNFSTKSWFKFSKSVIQSNKNDIKSFNRNEKKVFLDKKDLITVTDMKVLLML